MSATSLRLLSAAVVLLAVSPATGAPSPPTFLDGPVTPSWDIQLVTLYDNDNRGVKENKDMILDYPLITQLSQSSNPSSPFGDLVFVTEPSSDTFDMDLLAWNSTTGMVTEGGLRSDEDGGEYFLARPGYNQVYIVKNTVEGEWLWQ